MSAGGDGVQDQLESELGEGRDAVCDLALIQVHHHVACGGGCGGRVCECITVAHQHACGVQRRARCAGGCGKCHHIRVNLHIPGTSTTDE